MILSDLFEESLASVKLIGVNDKTSNFAEVFSESSYTGFYFHYEHASDVTGQHLRQQSHRPCQTFLDQLRALTETLCGQSVGNGSNAKKAKPNCDRNDASRFATIFVPMEMGGDERENSSCLVGPDVCDDCVFVLPSQERLAKLLLLRLYKVRQAPAFIIVDSRTKRTIAVDGKRALQADPLGRRFPWHLPEPTDIFRGHLVKNAHDGVASTTVDLNELRGVVKCLFFAAHWCPPCRLFTKQLTETYVQLKETDRRTVEFEVIFCSMDRCEDTFKQFFTDMPWMAFPYNDPRCIAASRLYNIQEIPTLLLLDSDNQLITRHGKSELAMDPTGQEFPWYPKVVLELNAYTACRLREEISVLLFTEGTPEDLAFAQTSLLPVAEDFCVRQSTGQQDMLFFYCAEDPLCDQVWENLSLGDASLPLICIYDPFTCNLFVCDDINVSEAIIRRFIEKFHTGDLEPTRRLVPPSVIVGNQGNLALSSPQHPGIRLGENDSVASASSPGAQQIVRGTEQIQSGSCASNCGMELTGFQKRYCL